MERGKDVDRERMVHHHIQRERDADLEAEQAVEKHFAESLKKYNNPNQVSVASHTPISPVNAVDNDAATVNCMGCLANVSGV